MKRVAFTLIAVFSFTVISVAQTWYLDINKAKSKAMESNTNIMIFFHGSDWCAPCIKLQHEVIDTEAFESWADENLILVDADFPRHKAN
ncbi:MAG: thioredoxin family protein [Bacteroidota bacterium]|nr:thioredoxin family protein [Bacteroidota bacterium]